MGHPRLKRRPAAPSISCRPRVGPFGGEQILTDVTRNFLVGAPVGAAKKPKPEVKIFMKRFFIVYAATAFVLLPLDFLFLGTLGKKLFNDNVRDMILASPRMLPAILFYGLYIAGTVTFVNGAAPGAWQNNTAYGALFGLFCYATFELTNMSLLKHWEWAVVVPDIFGALSSRPLQRRSAV